ncbi:hypothetical protein [Aureivirga sp. CE67]|uniref:hypothetical protein n=1 Tax=Aureivirga sp. CE67 TaxID=1788983 RepID=UPI0018CAB7DE|nr:hypothetical protein [Aureivirga sp. CE67]
MFQPKHQITLSDGDSYTLYGEDYFCDKKVFWEAHQSILKHLVEALEISKLPIKVLEISERKELKFETIVAFQNWLEKKHPCKHFFH